MRILIVDSSIATTGAFNCALNEAQLMSDRHTFIFVLPAQSTLKQRLEERGFKVYMLPMQEIAKSRKSLINYFPALIKNTRSLKKILKEEQIDVLQINDFYNMLGVTSKLMGFKKKLITYVRFLPASRPAPLRKIWAFMARRYSDKVIAVSDICMQQLPPSANTIRIYDPVNLKEKLPPKEYNSSPEVKILYQGNYIRGKGQDSALEAFALAYKQNPSIRLKYAGGDMGLEKNREFKHQLEQRVEALGLNDVVAFSEFTNRVEEGIKEADIVLNFSESESFSMTCLEASFYGTSLIATRCGGPEEIIIDGETGYLVPLHDYKAMSEAILKLANDPDRRKNFALAARKTVLERFPSEKFISEFEDALKN